MLPSEPRQVTGWVRSRHRGNRKLLFIDVDTESLIKEDQDCQGAEKVVNDQFDMYYKYKTSFTPLDGTITLVVFSEDTFVSIQENQSVTCDQLRKLLTVGSRIDCFAYEDNIEFYKDSEIPSWFQNTKRNTTNQILMLVTEICSITSSRPTPTTITLPKNIPEFTNHQKLYNSESHCSNAAHKKERTKMFVNWLQDTYGIEYLNSGTGVIDIAGGKGAISWELQCHNKIKSSLIDPRTVNLSGKQKKFLRKHGTTKFDHYQIALRGPESDKSVLEHLQMISLFENCSLIIGMHPDEATDCIIEYANYYKKPFAIVPCCVYTELFPNRQTRLGPVLTYDSLLDYLQYYKSLSLVKRTSLPFEGRSVILYSQKNA